MKYFLLFLIFLENFVLYGFRPWGQEKEEWTIITGIVMCLALILIIYLSWHEEKKKKEEERIN